MQGEFDVVFAAGETEKTIKLNQTIEENPYAGNSSAWSGHVPTIFTVSHTSCAESQYQVLILNTNRTGASPARECTSEPRLMAFIGGQLDLREAYVHPEVENALYVVRAKQEALTATEVLHTEQITEDCLPEAGYFYDSSDISDEAENQTDTYQLEVPTQDRVTFSTLISRMGWRALALGNVLKGKVAVL